jgi:aspartyl-tRNA(Asn)/glutamyl-tRNA(Gln) amidotransferase subunit B
MVKAVKQKELKGKIGLEIHAYLVTREKLFCNCIASRERGLKQNVNICPICTGQPGAKPMLPNGKAVEKAVEIGLMLGCSINKELKWQRKHYDWPDMPKGYQNTISGKYASPVGVKGKFEGIGIWSMHLEEDPASWTPDTGCVDYNRSGLPLVEIVTAPDFENAEQVMNWLGKLVHNLEYLKAIDSNAGIKSDVNVNLPNKTERVEIKNINSIENIGKAIEYELKRQALEGGKIKETRRWDEAKSKTMKMREKESGEDYRFMSEPDLADIVLDDKIISSLRDKIPESPEEKLKKLVKKYKIDKENAEVLTKNIDIVEFFEQVADGIDGKFALSWITGPLLRLLNDNGVKMSEAKIEAGHFVKLLEMVQRGKITELKAKEIIKSFYPKSYSIDEKKIEGKITDKKELEKVVLEVTKNNSKAAEDYKKGEKNALNFLMGEIMKATQKRADFKITRDVLEKLLKK